MEGREDRGGGGVLWTDEQSEGREGKEEEA